MTFSKGLVFCVMLAFTASAFCQSIDESMARWRAMGQALMEDENHPAAVEQFRKAANAEIAVVSDVINLGLTLYYAEQIDECIETLSTALESDPTNPFALYTLGLAYKSIGQTENALDAFEKTAAVDQTDAAVLYNLALALDNLQRQEEAIPWYESVIELDPLHSSSYYRLMQNAFRQRDMEKAREYQEIFRELKANEEQRPAGAIDEGKFTGPIVMVPAQEILNPPSNRSVEFRIHEELSSALHEDGLQSFVLAAIPDIHSRTTKAIISTLEGTKEVIISESLEITATRTIDENPYTRCFPADYDNDGLIDLLLVQHHEFHPNDWIDETIRQQWIERGSPEGITTIDYRVTLLRNTGAGYENTTAMLGDDLARTQDALWFDYDHEGDLDLYLCRPRQGDTLFQNNGDGTFSPVTMESLGISPKSSQSIAVTDYDFDNDLDWFLLNTSSPVALLRNERETFVETTVDFGLEPTNSNDVSAFLRVTHANNTTEPVIWLTDYSALDSTGFRVTPAGETIEEGDISRIRAFADINNDGYKEIITSRGQIVTSPGDIELASIEPERHALRYIHPTDLDFDGDLDLVTTKYQHGVFTVYENTNGNEANSIFVQIYGSKNSTFGFGSKLSIRDGLFRVHREVTQPLTHIGLGDRDTFDVLRITWPNGIFQNEINIAAGQILSITEKPGYAGSCPFIYTWNGERFEFIADGLSTGPLGLYVGGGQYFPPRPNETIRIRPDQLVDTDGVYQVRITEELREITYLDKIELLSVTHPDALEIYPNERFGLPPFPEFKLFGLSENARPVHRMTDNFGNDVTKLVSTNDHRYPAPFGGTTRYESIGDEYHFTIDLGDIHSPQEAILFMTGYVDWPNSDHARALEQNRDVHFVLPFLQSKNETGEWETVLNPMGFPAGKLKTVPLQLDGLLRPGETEVRIVSTLQIHWDRMWIDPTPHRDGFTIASHDLSTAELRCGGYAGHWLLNGTGPMWYDYHRRSSNQRWSYQLGAFTRYGDVYPLLTGFDDRYAIMQHGDEFALTFDATKPASDNATFLLTLTGWVKDAAHRTRFGDRVEPLPFRAMSAYPFSGDEGYPLTEANIDYLLEYNTRVFSDPNPPVRVPDEWSLPAGEAPTAPETKPPASIGRLPQETMPESRSPSARESRRE